MSRSRPEPTPRARAAARRAILLEATEAHYRDAALYDWTYSRRCADVRFYAALAASSRGPVLELGAGTGRVSIAMARGGASVVGADRMPEMLARARERLAHEPAAVRARIELRRGDLRTIRLRRRFPLVVSPFNVFNHLYDRRDLARALATVRAHLAPRGRFVFDVRVPSPEELARHPARTYRSGWLVHPATKRRYRIGEAFDYDPVTQIQSITIVMEDELDPEKTFVVPLAHRQLFPAELEAILHYEGFRIEERFGDFDRSALRADSESQIIVARVR